MKKFVAIIMMMMASMSAYASSSTHYNENTGENNPIISINEVTGFWRTDRFTYDKDMNIVFCQAHSDYNSYNKTCTKNGENGWRKLENVAPPGKKVIGLKSITVRGSHYVEIYWK